MQPIELTKTLREVLASLVGVWEGTYTHVAPDGGVLERFASRQETRIDGDRWYERITYRRDGQRPEVLDFRGRFEGDDDVVFDDADFEGRSRLVTDRHLLFPYRWKGQPDVELLELITLVAPDYRTRLWERFTSGALDRLTVIEERRVPGAEPEVWT